MARLTMLQEYAQLDNLKNKTDEEQNRMEMLENKIMYNRRFYKKVKGD